MEIICKYGLFDYSHKVYICDEEKNITLIGSVETPNLPKTLIELCNNYKIYNLHLFGAESALQNIQDNILFYKEIPQINFIFN